jgi:hypothetical protein
LFELQRAIAARTSRVEKHRRTRADIRVDEWRAVSALGAHVHRHRGVGGVGETPRIRERSESYRKRESFSKKP